MIPKTLEKAWRPKPKLNIVLRPKNYYEFAVVGAGHPLDARDQYCDGQA